MTVSGAPPVGSAGLVPGSPPVAPARPSSPAWSGPAGQPSVATARPASAANPRTIAKRSRARRRCTMRMVFAARKQRFRTSSRRGRPIHARRPDPLCPDSFGPRWRCGAGNQTKVTSRRRRHMRKLRERIHNGQEGFTLIELLVVILIIGSWPPSRCRPSLVSVRRVRTHRRSPTLVTCFRTWSLASPWRDLRGLQRDSVGHREQRSARRVCRRVARDLRPRRPPTTSSSVRRSRATRSPTTRLAPPSPSRAPATRAAGWQVVAPTR